MGRSRRREEGYKEGKEESEGGWKLGNVGRLGEKTGEGHEDLGEKGGYRRGGGTEEEMMMGEWQ